MPNKIETKRYQAAYGDGEPVTLLIHTTMIDVTAAGDPGPTFVRGMATLKTDRGETLNRLEQGKYEVVGTGRTVHCADLNAP